MKDMKEEKMRKRRRILALFLCLTLLLSAVGSVYASADPGKVIQEDWRNFRGNSSHNAVTDSPVPTSASDAALYWATKSGSGYGGSAVGSPIYVDGYQIGRAHV